jgi:hypothetical protein
MIDPSYQQIFYKSQNSEFSYLEGVNNLSIVNDISFSEDYILGGIRSASLINAPQDVNLTFDRSFIGKDNLFKYTGQDPICKMIIYNGCNYYNLNNLYLNMYSAGFTVGELPKISTKFTSYGDEITQSSTLKITNDNTLINKSNIILDLPALQSIYISGENEYTSLRIKNNYNIYSFDYQLELTRQPFYNIGSKIPNCVFEMTPIKIDFSINSKLKNDSYIIDNPEIFSLNYLDFSIVVSGKYDNMIFPIKKSTLISTEISLSNLNTLEVKRKFKGYYGL